MSWLRYQAIYAPQSATGTDSLTATGVATGAPSVGSPALGQIHALAATGVATAAPSVDSPALGQIHALTATGVATGTPSVGSPALDAAGGTDALTATGVASGAPTVGTPALGQAHALTATGIATGAPAVGAPSIGQKHALGAAGVAAGTPSVGSPSLGQVHGLTATGIAAGAPMLGAPGINAAALIAIGTVAGVPVLGAPALAVFPGSALPGGTSPSGSFGTIRGPSSPDAAIIARPQAPRDDRVRLRIGDRDWETWTECRITRGIERLAADFSCTVSERRIGAEGGRPWQVRMFDPCEVRIGEDLVLTGHVDAVQPMVEATQHVVRIAGRSRTADLIDCQSEVEGGEFRNSDLAAIARAVAQPFGVQVVAEADVGAPFDLVAMEKTETVFAFLERLARLRGVLLTDDPQGRLVIARADSGAAAGRLVQGDRVLAAQGDLNGGSRFSKYIVLGQSGSLAAVAADPGTGEPEPPGGGDQPAVVGTAADSVVPRYRPRVITGEQQMTAAEAAERARWEAAYAAGRSVRARITVPGWRQDDGTPWAINRTIPVTLPFLQIDRTLLIASVTFVLSRTEGRRTVLELGPPEGFTPEPVTAAAAGKGARGGEDWMAGRGITAGAGRLD